MTSTDYTWDIVEQYQWCFAEVNAGIVCASIPALKPFFARYLPGLLSSSLHSRDRKSGHLKNSAGYNHFDNSRDIKLRKDIHDTAYELRSLDNMSDELVAANKNKSDDEASLWPTNGKKSRRSEIVQAPKASCSADPSAPEKSGNNAIYVTSETRIDFGRP